MTEMSRRFNFDDFDELCREALDDHARQAEDARMAQEGIELEESERWAEHDARPGERGHPINKGRPALVCLPTGETVEIDGKTYRILKLQYDLDGKYVPLATMKPQ